MPEKAEYWSLNARQFRKIKTKVIIGSQMVFNYMKPLGFTDYYSTETVLYGRIIRHRKKLGVQIEFGYEETPECFSLSLLYEVKGKGSYPVFISERLFNDLEAFKNSFEEEMKILIEKIKEEDEKVILPEG